MSTLVIRGGRIVDATGERRADVLVGPDGVIKAVAEGLSGDRTLDAGGCLVAPGLVDLASGIGQPGDEESETIETAARAAALGGYTAIVALPTTDPVADDPSVVREIRRLAEGACCEVHPAAPVTVGRGGSRLVPMAELAAAGVRLFVDEGTGVQDAAVLRRALEYSTDLDVVIGQHCEVPELARNGHMHEGEWSSRLGIGGIPAEAEEIAVMRDLALARLTGGRLHFRHLSTGGSLAMVAAARNGGVAVSAEVAAVNLLLTDAEVAAFDPRHKVSPPLRPVGEVAEVRGAVATGSVDAVVSDHTPCAIDAKELPFDEAPPGGASLETTLAVAMTALDLAPQQLLALLSWQPAALAGLADHGGPVAAGRTANLCVIDPTQRWSADPNRFASLTRTSAVAGYELTGRVRHTILGGEPVVVDAEATR
ncbi:MAG: dihydroorotase [Actinomycetota bacterium]|nr:dihydroorotase [Actinomycetota bacterium]